MSFFDLVIHAAGDEHSIPAEWISSRDSDPAAVVRKQASLEKLTALLRPGDQFRKFRSSPRSWRHRSGRSGYVILRNGTQVASILVSMN